MTGFPFRAAMNYYWARGEHETDHAALRYSSE